MTERFRSKRPTIIDVAQRAGVSHTTVSFIINDVASARITEETRARVLAAITELDYHPHAGARSMGRRSSLAIGVAIPDSKNAHYQEIVAGIEAYAAAQGYSVLVSTTNFDAERERRCFQSLKQQQLDGLIMIPSTGHTVSTELQGARRQGAPLVLLGSEHDTIDTVQPEAMRGEQQILDHLTALGHRRIGYVYGVADHDFHSKRLAACLQIQQALGLPVVAHWIRRCGPTVEDGYYATQALLTECAAGERPTALIVVNDLLAAAVVAMLTETGIRIPEHMSVATFDNTTHARYTVVPRLTSVDYEAHTIGTHAAQLLIERMADPQRPPVHVKTHVHLVPRESTGPAPNAEHS